MWQRGEAVRHYVEALGLLSLLSLAMLGYRYIETGTTRYSFIPWNLLLAWTGLILGWFLVNQLKVRRWMSWQNIILSIAWLFFLPNTWYVLTDFLHVYPTGEISELYDFALMSTLSLVGFILGFTSLYLVHKQLAKRFNAQRSWMLVTLVIFLASFGIYMGRVLRWNSWDLVANPSGLIINVSDRVYDPAGNPHFLNITGLFFVLIFVSYVAFWRGLQVIETSKNRR